MKYKCMEKPSACLLEKAIIMPGVGKKYLYRISNSYAMKTGSEGVGLCKIILTKCEINLHLVVIDYILCQSCIHECLATSVDSV